MRDEGVFLKHRMWQRFAWMLFVFFAFWQLCGVALAQAADAVCAEVKIVIEQKLSLERQAFDARMIITNGLTDQKLENVSIELLFFDENNTPINATTDPNAVGSPFFFRTDRVEGVNSLTAGTINEKAVADINWLIIPSAGTGGDQSQGKVYYIGAKLTYTIEGKTETVEVTPEFIVVRPQPLLELDYFLPRDVHGDDPFTAPVEPPEPFTLGVRVKNVGAGVSYKTHIESAQPKIVENDQGLLVGFEILGGFVGDQPAGKSLLLNFGDVDGGTAATGRWNMVTTLSGKFVEFDASFTHADSLGGAVTSLLSAVRTHTLVSDVLVDLAGRDQIRDFLARDGSVLRVYESDGNDTEVLDQSDRASLSSQGATSALSFPPVANGFAYARVPDPSRGSQAIGAVRRSDGYILPPENAWLSKERDDNLQWHYYINIFDANTTGQYQLGFAQSEFAQITGSVYRDVNGNGVRDEGEPAMGGAPVVLTGVETTTGQNVQTTAHTEADGSFQFVNLKPGTYHLAADVQAGFIDGVALAGSAGGQAMPGVISGIALTAGMSATNYQFAKTTVGSNGTDAADLAIALSVSLDNAKVGDTVTLTIAASNQGPANAQATAVSVGLPVNLKVTGSQASIGSFSGSSWSIGSFAADSQAQLTLELEVTAKDPQNATMTASIGSSTRDPITTNNSRTISIAVEQGDAVKAAQHLWQGTRVLLYVGCTSNAVDCPQLQISSAQEALSDVAESITTVTTEQALRVALRSGAHSVIWLHGSVQGLSADMLTEIQAAAVRGVSVMLDGSANDESIASAGLWAPGLGAVYAGDTSNVRIDGQAIAIVGASRPVQVSNDTQTHLLFADDNVAVAQTALGQGQVWIAGFDVLGSNLSQALLKAFLQEQITEAIAPKIVDPMLAGSRVSLVSEVTNLSADDVVLDLTTQLGNSLKLLQAQPAATTSDNDKALWRQSLAAQSAPKNVIAELQLPEQTQAIVVQSALVNSGTQTAVQSWQFPVRVIDQAEAQSHALSIIAGITNAPSSQQAALDAIADLLAQAQQALNSQDHDAALDALLDAFTLSQNLQGVSQQAVLQQAISRWLGLAAVHWSDGQGPGASELSIAVFAGSGQSTHVSSEFGQVLMAKVSDEEGLPVAGVLVNFVLPAAGPSATFAGGALQATAHTDAQGIASSPVLTANAQVGSFTAQALTDQAVAPVEFALTNLAISAPYILLQPQVGDGQTTTVNTKFAQALQVLVTDANGQALADRAVVFSLPASGASALFAGDLATVTVQTNTQGLATSPLMVANATAGSWTATASTAGAQQAVEFGFTNVPVATPVWTLQVITGHGQSTPVNTAYAEALRVRVVDAQGLPVSGQLVSFAAPDSGASVVFGGSQTTAQVSTDAQGYAQAPQMQANASVGNFVVNASTVNAQAPVQFSLENTAVATPRLNVQMVSGFEQTATIESAFAQGLRVRVTDAAGLPVEGVHVHFEAPTSGASALFGSNHYEQEVTTNAQGEATSAVPIANATAGQYVVFARVANGVQAATFTLSNVPVSVPVIVLQSQAGDGQTATVNTGFAQALQVLVTDANGQALADRAVVFSLPVSGASALFAGNLTTVTVQTNTQGLASSPLMVANPVAGSWTATASTAGAQQTVQFGLTNSAIPSADNRLFTGATPTGTGIVKSSIVGGGAQCRFNPENTAIKRPEGVVPILQMLLFPHGVFDFELIGCDPGSTVTVTTEWPNLLNITGYLKYGPTPTSRGRSIWYPPQNLKIVGRAISFTITDGGWGDDDLTANGIIRDPGGPVIQTGPLPAPETPVQVPVNTKLGLLLLALAMLFGAKRVQRAGFWRAAQR
ncbi:DUF11 domain-containing protein [Lampropedia puyangensis]|uniref:DUF11 domain-containing protein n=1 Tax=Lampropedia puyangensis TaxID=1330072 RepID=A0A4S8ESD3_9BURK|nr:choice-of-anchor U domain-containing protein [Lampropedia puyangensis]THT97697.1 DUF11 domain-containing protein [Lampropedia puyangensis]